MKKLIFILMMFVPVISNGQILVKDNGIVIDSLDISTVTTRDSVILSIQPYKYFPSERRGDPQKISTVEIQISWGGLTGTLDGEVEVYQKTYDDLPYFLYDDTQSKKTLSTASGNYLFTWKNWAGSDIKIVFIKNNCTGGYLSAGAGVR